MFRDFLRKSFTQLIGRYSLRDLENEPLAIPERPYAVVALNYSNFVRWCLAKHINPKDRQLVRYIFRRSDLRGISQDAWTLIIIPATAALDNGILEELAGHNWQIQSCMDELIQRAKE